MEINDEFDYYQGVATSSFGDMLHDDERNRKFSVALKKAIDKRHSKGEKAHVLDIGTGTGLLAMLAVRHGADSVVACEMFAPVAACASKIIEENGFSSKIKLVNKHSTSLTVGPDGDLTFKANILVSEVFDTELIGEGAIQTFNHAHAVLLEENSIVIPSIGTIYGQVIESETLLRWNTLEEWKDGDISLVTVPKAIRDCAGAPSLFDIQLSQFPRSQFVPLTQPVPLFRFDFMRCKKIPTHEYQSVEEHAINSGKAHAVLMWWDLVMDDEGDVVLSCAPVWHHPDAPDELPCGNPAVGIPWRDHWMQAVYFLRSHTAVIDGGVLTLRGWHDEFSLWFAVCACGGETHCGCKSERPPVCECGLHMLTSRTRLAAMNDPKRRAAYLSTARTLLRQSTHFIYIGDFSLLGILLARLGAVRVFVYTKDPSVLGVNIQKQFSDSNGSKVSFHNDLASVAKEVQSAVSSNGEVAHKLCIVGEPYFQTSLLPWENALFISAVEEFFELCQDSVKRENVAIAPKTIVLKACCVQFDDLWKISRPLNKCMGFKVNLFDELVTKAKENSQASPEPQPLWEYPCKARSKVVTLLELNLLELSGPVQTTAVLLPHRVDSERGERVDGVAVWSEYMLSVEQSVGTGPVGAVQIGEYVEWDRHERQGVHLYDIPVSEESVVCSIKFDPATALFDLNFLKKTTCK